MAKTTSLAVLSVALLSNVATAQSICRSYEYAELRDMRRERLEQMYCQYNQAMLDMLTAALAEIKAGHAVSSQQARGVSNRCAQELERIEQILEAKFSASKPSCSR